VPGHGCHRQCRQDTRETHGGEHEQYDVIIIGAGISGLYQLYRIREREMSVRVFEAESDVGGTWCWNRYPGARFDSESYSYSYSFSEELLHEREWSEHFSAQPETLSYLNVVADEFDPRRDIQFDSRVRSATFDEDGARWIVDLEQDRIAASRFLITAIGPLSAPTMPNIEGVERFDEESYHTAQWPRQSVAFEGKRVAVIGTGAIGVQVIQEVAKMAEHLTVFQRTPNYCSAAAQQAYR
jgi:cation diffusion facilitator CzcD-associated flavoprotein CzcO